MEANTSPTSPNPLANTLRRLHPAYLDVPAPATE